MRIFLLKFFLPKIVKFLTDVPISLVFSTPFFELFSMVMESASKKPSYTSRRAFYSLLKKTCFVKKNVLNMFFLRVGDEFLLAPLHEGFVTKPLHLAAAPDHST